MEEVEDFKILGSFQENQKTLKQRNLITPNKKDDELVLSLPLIKHLRKVWNISKNK